MSYFEWIKKFLTSVYKVFLNPLYYWHGSENRHVQDCTHEEIRKTNVQSERATLNRGEGEDTVDIGLAGDLKHSLDKVSEAIYKKFVLSWHGPPEELQNQPLYKEINSGIQGVFFNIKSKARPLEEYEIIISIITGLIAHFKNKRGKKVTSRFKTRQEEVDFIRKHIKCLLDYWLPDSMQRSQLIYVFLTEILSVNVVEQIINDYSEYTFINEVIIAILDDQPATQQPEDSGRCDEKIYDNSYSVLNDSSTIMESDNSASRKKEKKGIGKKMKGWFKPKTKKQKCKDVPKFRSHCQVIASSTLQYYDDVADIGSHDDSENDEKCMTSVIDTSLQMWLRNNWTAKVSKKLEEKEDEYEISVYDESLPGTVLWNTIRRVKDFEFIYMKICQKYPYLKEPKTTGGPTNDADRQFFHLIGKTPDEFINILLSLVKIHGETEAVFFFSPFEYEDEEEDSSEHNTDDDPTGDSSNSGIDSDFEIEFRTLSLQNEEETSNKVTAKISSSSDIHDTSNVCANGNKSNSDDELRDCYEADGNYLLRSRKKHKKCKSASCSKLEDMPCTSVARNEEFTSDTADMNTELLNTQQQSSMNMDFACLNPQQLYQKGLDVTDQNITQTMELQKKLQKTLLDVLFQLIDVVLAGGKSKVCFLHRNGLLTHDFSNYILKSIPNIYAENQIIWYLNQVAELLMSEERPQQLTPKVLQSKALDVLKIKVKGLLTNNILKFLLEKWIMNNLKASHQALEDPLANKETLYGLLENFTKIITNEVEIFNL